MHAYILYILLVSMFWTTPLFAHKSPAGCLGSGLGISLFVSSPSVFMGEVISYDVNIFNGVSGPIVCDVSNIFASIITPDGIVHPLALTRTLLVNGESDFYPSVVTYIARSQDVKSDGTLMATASNTGTVHQRDTDSTGGGFQGVNTTVSTTPPVLVAVVPPPPPSPPRGPGDYWAPLPLIALTKTPTPLSLPLGSGSVTYTYSVTNIGKVPMSGIWVTDDKCTPVTFVSGDTNNDTKLDLTETWLYRCTKTLSQTETNIATTHGGANGWDVYATASSTVAVRIPPPLIKIIKTPDRKSLPSGGGAVTYTYWVSNPGTVILRNVSVTDDKCAKVNGHLGDVNTNNMLDLSETWIYTCSMNLTETTTNIATAIGHANGFTVTDPASATVLVGTPLFPNTGLPPYRQSTGTFK